MLNILIIIIYKSLLEAIKMNDNDKVNDIVNAKSFFRSSLQVYFPQKQKLTELRLISIVLN